MIVEDSTVGDKRITTEWNPYNPRILDEVDGEITLKGIFTLEELKNLMTSRIYGYTSTIERYLKLDPETAQEQLLDWMHHKDELTYLNWMWRILAHNNTESNNIVWQMPEDTVKSFNIVNDSQEDILSMNDNVFIYSTMDVNNIHDHALGVTSDIAVYELYSLKALSLFLLCALTKRHASEDNTEITITYNDLCNVYVENIQKYINFKSVDNCIPSLKLISSGYLTTGKYYKLKGHGISYDTFFQTVYLTKD